MYHFVAVTVLLGLAAVPTAAQLLVSPPRAGEQETAQAGGGSGRFGFVGALRCPEGRAMVALRVTTGPLLNGLALGCAEVICEAGQCRWRPGQLAWQPRVGSASGTETTLACESAAAVSGFRAETVAVAQGSAIASLAIECAALMGIDPAGGFAVAPVDGRLGRRFMPPGPAAARVVSGSCRDRSAAAFSVAVGTYPAGAGGQGEHVRALSMFCPGLVR